jgi:hypothetical protein
MWILVPVALVDRPTVRNSHQFKYRKFSAFAGGIKRRYPDLMVVSGGRIAIIESSALYENLDRYTGLICRFRHPRIVERPFIFALPMEL